MIELTYTKGRGASDQVRIRSECSDVRLDNPRRGPVPPPELVHFVVESLFGLEGFLRRVATGREPADAQTATTAEGRQVEALVEVLQSEASRHAPEEEAAFVEAVRQACEKRGISGLALSERAITQARSLYAELSARWEELHPEQSITLALAPSRRRTSLDPRG